MVRRYTAAIRRPVHLLSAPLLSPARRANAAHVLQPPVSHHGTLTFGDWLNEAQP